MLKVGITGGIGSGKTTVCKIFELLNIPVYYADIEAKNILDNNYLVKQKIIDAFGKSVINEKSGHIDRPQLATIVFNDKLKLNTLNNIVHPAVAQHFNDWLILNQYAPYILKEAAILIESGSYKQTDKIISVIAPETLRIERVLKRDHTTPDEIKKRIANQISDDEKIKLSQFVIYNDEINLVIPQVLNIHNQLITLKK